MRQHLPTLILVVLLAASIAAFCGPEPAKAAHHTTHHESAALRAYRDGQAARRCHQLGAPRGLCRYLVAGTHLVHAPRRWAYSTDLLHIIKRESSYNPCAVNPTHTDCSYTGSHACGWFQLNPCRCYPNRIAQVHCGLLYIKNRYTTPRRAWQHELAYGWY